jgi:hypothetical protein
MDTQAYNQPLNTVMPLLLEDELRLQELGLPVKETTQSVFYYRRSNYKPTADIIFDSPANIPGTTLVEQSDGDTGFDPGDIEVTVKEEIPLVYSQNPRLTTIILENATLTGKSVIKPASSFDAPTEQEEAVKRRPSTLPKFIHPENILCGSANADNATLEGGCGFYGDAKVLGGEHLYLLASGNAHVECTRTHRTEFILGGTIKGNYTVEDLSFYGDGVEINDLGTLPAGLEPFILELQDGDPDVPTYESFINEGWVGFSDTKWENISRFNRITCSIVKDSRFWSQRLCLDTHLHKQYTENCHCLVWLPRILTFDPRAISYLIRVSGQMGSPDVKIPLAHTGADNPLAHVTLRALEESLASEISTPNVLTAWHRNDTVKEQWGEAWRDNLEACGIPAPNTEGWADKLTELYEENVNRFLEYALGF